MEDKIFKCPNDLKVTVKKDGGEVVLDEECCTGMVILLKNDGNMATSFYGYHNEKLIKLLNKAQKKYFKGLKKRLKTESIDDNIEVKSDDIPKEKKWDEGKQVPNSISSPKSDGLKKKTKVNKT